MPTSFTHISYEDISNPLIRIKPADDLQYVLVIPAFAEASLLPVLRSLYHLEGVSRAFEVIILINESDDVDEKNKQVNQQSFRELQNIKSELFLVHVVYVKEIPKKKAGVGLARKLAMDEAVRRLQSANSYDQGIIINLDADCTVSHNYFNEIRDYFYNHKKIELCNIHWEHDLSLAVSNEESEAIISYELHLRYFIGMQRYLTLPYAFQTIGSAFAVRAPAYIQVGGMNTRKAGEDFYFIHKFTKKATAGDLNTCTVYPSPRPSFRVPFGTGKAVSDQLVSGATFVTYHPQSFYDLVDLVDDVSKWYTSSSDFSKLSAPIKLYLNQNNFEQVLEKLRQNSSSVTTFKKAFFQWFDAFRLMKYLHLARDEFYPSITVLTALNDTAHIWKTSAKMNPKEWLSFLRIQHKNSIYRPNI